LRQKLYLKAQAAHEVEHGISREDARDILELTEAILLYVFSLDRKFRESENRRAGATAEVSGAAPGEEGKPQC
jgi:hypothetical protein